MAGKKITTDTVSGGFVKLGGASGGYQATVDKRSLSDPAEDTPVVTKGAGKGRKTKLSVMGLRKEIIAEGNPNYAKALKHANQYRKIRMRELAHLHGHVSAGAGALLASASLALAGSRFLYEQAAEAGDSHLLKQASQLADSARQSELAAWEMSAKEGVLKRRQEASAAGMPWLLGPEVNQVKVTGRKTNAERQSRDADVHVPEMVDLPEETPDE